MFERIATFLGLTSVPGLKKLGSWTSIASRHEDNLVTKSPLTLRRLPPTPPVPGRRRPRRPPDPDPGPPRHAPKPSKLPNFFKPGTNGGSSRAAKGAERFRHRVGSGREGELAAAGSRRLSGRLDACDPALGPEKPPEHRVRLWDERNFLSLLSPGSYAGDRLESGEP